MATELTCNEAAFPVSQGDAVFRCELRHMHDGDHLHEDHAKATDREAEVVVTYSFSSSSAGWFSTVWQIRRLRDGHVAMSGRTFGRRHEQRAWEQMQHVARRYGYAD